MYKRLSEQGLGKIAKKIKTNTAKSSKVQEVVESRDCSHLEVKHQTEEEAELFVKYIFKIPYW